MPQVELRMMLEFDKAAIVYNADRRCWSLSSFKDETSVSEYVRSAALLFGRTKTAPHRNPDRHVERTLLEPRWIRAARPSLTRKAALDISSEVATPMASSI